jgi:DNA-binding SARP family transcriptional activator
MGSPAIQVRLFGALELRFDGAALPPLESARTESLLAYLLLHRDAPQPRQHLAFLLWPDSAEPQARTNLRHLLYTLRHALPDSDRLLEVTPRTLRWRPDAPLWLDVSAFEAASSSRERNTEEELAVLQVAAALYRGDLLEGSYDEWILAERERLRARYLDVLARLTTLLEARGDSAGATQFAEELVRRDSLSEEAYRQLMRLYDVAGDRARAMRVYHACVATLERELGVEPSPLTRAAYDALLPADQPAVSPRPRGVQGGGFPLVGRQAERARLAGLWRVSERGRAQLVVVTGEPGVGKTRLVKEFRGWCMQGGAVTAEARAYAAEGALAYGPVVEWLRAEGIRTRLGRLDRARLAELARLLPEFRTVVLADSQIDKPPGSDRRQRLFDAAARAILSAEAPLLLVADDLQWWDRETLQFLHYLLRVQPDARLLVAATARDDVIDRGHPFGDLLAGLHALDRCTAIPLARLSRIETAALAEQIGGSTIDDADRFYSETEGNPLFVVEAVRAGWRGGNDNRNELSPKVQAAIESRLAQLSEPARDLVGLAAAVGRAFTTDILLAASDAGEDVVVQGLDELWRRRITREQGSDAYDFSHDKIREVAYHGLSPAHRRRAHRRIAGALAQHHALDPGPVSGQIAAHYEQAGRPEDAIAWYGRAAEMAQQLFANAEAVRLLDRALTLLRTLPETAERQTQGLALLAALPAPLGAAEGYASDRLSTELQRALDLSRALGVEPNPPLLRSLAMAMLSRRDFPAARGFGERLHARGMRDADDLLLVEADYVLGIAAFWQGEFDTARGHFESAVERYRAEHRRAHLLRYGLDPRVICLSRLGNTLWFLGRPDAAVRSRDAALTLADEIGHPFTRSTALVFAATLAVDMHDAPRVRDYAAALSAADDEDSTIPIRVSLETFRGYVETLDGRAEAGITRIRRALEDAGGADHAPGMNAHAWHMLIETCRVAGDARTGLEMANRALVASGAARLWEAETRRIRGEFLAALGAPADEVEAELQRALEVARRQGTVSLEMRAATSLARYFARSGDLLKTRDARERVKEIVSRYPEGNSSADVVDALSAVDGA